MKTQIVLLLFSLGFFNGFSQPNIDSLFTHIVKEQGFLHVASQQFLSFNFEANQNLGKSYYAIIPPIYETYIDTVPQVKDNIHDSLKRNILNISYDIKPSSYHWTQRTLEDTFVKKHILYHSRLANLTNSDFLLIYAIEEEPVSKSVKCYQSSNNDDYQKYNDFISIEKQRLISHGTVKRLSSKNEVLHPNQIVIELSNGNWKEFKQVLVPFKARITIKQIQVALNKKGYKCRTDGFLDKETKNVLNQFQKDNHIIHSCRFTHETETFKKLGLTN